MRLSLLASACTSAVLVAAFTLPLQAQPAPKTATPTFTGTTIFTVAGKDKKSIRVRCEDTKNLGQCIDGTQGLSAKEKSQLKLAIPKLRAETKQLMAKALAKAQDRSGTCFAMKVYEYPKGFPENGAAAQAKVSDCTSAALVKEKDVTGQAAGQAKVLTMTRQH